MPNTCRTTATSSNDPKWRDVEQVGWKYEAAALQTQLPALTKAAGGPLLAKRALSVKGVGTKIPEMTGVSPGEVTLVEATLATLWVATRQDKFATHKAEQIPKTVFIARQLHPTAHIVYRILAPRRPPPETQRLIEELLRADPNVEVVWGILGSGARPE